MKKILLFVVILATIMPQACAQRPQTSDINYRKAIEAFYEEDDDEKALTLVDKQLEDNPEHLDSRFLRSKIYWRADRYDNALRDVTFAIKHYKGNPGVYKSTLHGLRGNIYEDMRKYPEAIADFRMACKLAKKDNPERVQSYMFDCAQACFNNDDFKGAEEVFQAMLKIDKTDIAAMVGIARNRLQEENYEDALKWLEEAESYDASYASLYKFKMRVYDGLGETDKSIDAALKYYSLDDDAPVWYVEQYASKHYSYAVAKIKAEINKENSSSRWKALLTKLYENHGDYEGALGIFRSIEEDYGENSVVLYHIARCYQEMGDFTTAIKEMSKAIRLSDDRGMYAGRGDIYRSAGMYDKAIADYKIANETDPSHGYEYYALGWCYELQGNKTKALEYYNAGIDIDGSYPFLFVSRADLLKELGRASEAEADYLKVLELDDDAESGSCRHYALHGLGKDQEALEWMDEIIKSAPYESGNYYDKACLLARMGKKAEAIAALEDAFKKGFRRFAHMENDHDMDPLRNMPEYKALVAKYKEMKYEAPEPEVLDETPHETIISEIPVKKKSGGTYEVACSINGLPLKFILDTGASDVTISSVEADFMLKNDYLSMKDFRGSRKYLTADGNVSEGSVICLREIEVGDIKLKNVEASVVKNQKAPLLLGQSALERFGRITIDNDNSKIIVRH